MLEDEKTGDMVSSRNFSHQGSSEGGCSYQSGHGRLLSSRQQFLPCWDSPTGDRRVGGGEGRERSSQTGERGVGAAECRDVPITGSSQVEEGDLEEDDEEVPAEQREFSEKDRKWMKQCLPQNCFESHCWKNVVSDGRPLLMEVACSKNSILCSEVEKRCGSKSFIRCSIWNGYDLTTQQGVDACKQVLRSEGPINVWISCECGPFSPLQHINQRSEKQREDLKQKQAETVKQYFGGIDVARFARSLGIHVHWELSARCEAWNLPCIQDFIHDLGLSTVVCSGCTVGLKNPRTNELLGKSWKIASSHPVILRHMNLPCQKNHKHGPCEKGIPKYTAFYTPVFATKVVDSLLEGENWNDVASELFHGNGSCQHEGQDCFSSENEPQDEHGYMNMTKEERERILRDIRHIHSVTGHCSVKYLVDALKRRGVSERVIQVAKTFTCPTCDEMKRPDVRLPATLEMVHPKWKVVQTDVADWNLDIGLVKCCFNMLLVLLLLLN